MSDERIDEKEKLNKEEIDFFNCFSKEIKKENDREMKRVRDGGGGRHNKNRCT